MNEQQRVDLKAELEVVDEDEFREELEPLKAEVRELRARLAVLSFKFNELIDILDKKLAMPTLGYSKVKEE